MSRLTELTRIDCPRSQWRDRTACTLYSSCSSWLPSSDLSESLFVRFGSPLDPTADLAGSGSSTDVKVGSITVGKDLLDSLQTCLECTDNGFGVSMDTWGRKLHTPNMKPSCSLHTQCSIIQTAVLRKANEVSRICNVWHWDVDSPSFNCTCSVLKNTKIRRSRGSFSVSSDLYNRTLHKYCR